MKALPNDTHLAYTIYHETTWWRQLCQHSRPNDGRPTINIAASAQGSGGGVGWEFTVYEADFGNPGPVLHLGMFNDSWQAFQQVPDFFAALSAGEVETLADVVALLDRLGAVDETERPIGGAS